MKVVCIKKYGDYDKFPISMGKIYDLFELPIIHDPQTLQPCPQGYIIKCDDNMSRRINNLELDHFMKIEDYRNNRLESIGI